MEKNKRKYLVLFMVLAFVLSLGLVGCANGTVDPNVEEKVDDVKEIADDAVKDVEDSVREINYDDIKITAEQVFDKFIELHPGTKIKKIDLDKELMEYQYVVEGYDDKNEYEVKINPIDGKIISDDSEAIDLDDEKVEITKDQLANVNSIIEKAKKEDGSNSELDEWNISVEDGKIIMDVEIGAIEYSYDMETQKLLEKDR